MSRFERLAIVGLGLLGGSVALAARRADLAETIVGAGRRRGPLDWALVNGVIDEAADPMAAVTGADLVVLATPVGTMDRVLRETAGCLRDGALVTDVGSVKSVLADTLPGLLPAGVIFVGAHPMAGSHLRGVEHARADLFDGAVCAVTPPAGCGDAAERVAGFWRALGCRVVTREPESHDAEVAWMSHVPHVLAFAFAHALERAPRGAGELAGGGFRDFTRIARSDAELWGDILRSNAKALVGPLQECGEALQRVARAIEDGDIDAIEGFLAEARTTLASVENAQSGGGNPETTATAKKRGH